MNYEIKGAPIESQSPWIDCMGRNVSDEKLKRLCQSWTTAEWEAYLIQFEVPLKETLEGNFDALLEERMGEAPDVIFEGANGPSLKRQDLTTALRRAIRRLTPMQQKVIYLIFWRKFSERRAAQKMGLSRVSIRTHLARSIKRLREFLSPSLPLVQGQKRKSPTKRCLFQEINRANFGPARRPKP